MSHTWVAVAFGTNYSHNVGYPSYYYKFPVCITCAINFKYNNPYYYIYKLCIEK